MPQSGIEPTSPPYKRGPHPLKVSGAKIKGALGSLEIVIENMTQITKGDTATLAPPVNWILFVLVLDEVLIKIP